MPPSSILAVNLIGGQTPVNITRLSMPRTAETFNFCAVSTGPTSSTSVKPGSYRLELVLYDSMPCFTQTEQCNPNAKVIAKDQSDAPFSIVAQPKPSITVTSPKGGEVWAVGSQKSITWKGGGPTSSIVIKLVSVSPLYGCGTADSFLVKEIAYGTANDGSENWTVPKDLKPGGYCMRVSALNEGLSDDSDKPFDIAPAPPKPPLRFNP